MEQYLLRQQIRKLTSGLFVHVLCNRIRCPPPVYVPSSNEKVRLAHGLPWEKLVRKKGHQHFICPKQTFARPFYQSSPKVLRLRATGNCLFNWFSIVFLDRIYLELYFEDGYQFVCSMSSLQFVLCLINSPILMECQSEPPEIGSSLWGGLGTAFPRGLE